MVAEKSSYNAKTEIIKDFLKKGSGGGKICSQETYIGDEVIDCGFH